MEACLARNEPGWHHEMYRRRPANLSMVRFVVLIEFMAYGPDRRYSKYRTWPCDGHGRAVRPYLATHHASFAASNAASVRCFLRANFLTNFYRSSCSRAITAPSLSAPAAYIVTVVKKEMVIYRENMSPRI